MTQGVRTSVDEIVKRWYGLEDLHVAEESTSCRNGVHQRTTLVEMFHRDFRLLDKKGISVFFFGYGEFDGGRINVESQREVKIPFTRAKWTPSMQQIWEEEFEFIAGKKPQSEYLSTLQRLHGTVGDALKDSVSGRTRWLRYLEFQQAERFLNPLCRTVTNYRREEQFCDDRPLEIEFLPRSSPSEIRDSRPISATMRFFEGWNPRYEVERKFFEGSHGDILIFQNETFHTRPEIQDWNELEDRYDDCFWACRMIYYPGGRA